MNFFTSKKGDSGQEEHGFPLTLLIRVLFGTFLASLVLVIFIYKPGHLLMSNYYDQNAESSFDDLVDAIENKQAEAVVNIHEDYNVYSFIQDRKLVVSWLRRTGISEGDYYLNPCKDANCVCLYEGLLDEMKCVETLAPIVMRNHIGVTYFSYDPELEDYYPLALNNFKGSLSIEYDDDYVYIDKKTK